MEGVAGVDDDIQLERERVPSAQEPIVEPQQALESLRVQPIVEPQQALEPQRAQPIVEPQPAPELQGAQLIAEHQSAQESSRAPEHETVKNSNTLQNIIRQHLQPEHPRHRSRMNLRPETCMKMNIEIEMNT